ncbi:MAG: hypothetical protein CW691_06980 [Candidatus Bathyarchaeum sp.]|nr:MAG: hypothetical protein CW691_06980 [Candidatus Bathyarchaeum sp.]
MKGLSLPINAVVIILIVLIVLLAVSTMFLGVWEPQKDSFNIEMAKSRGCRLLEMDNCKDPSTIIINDFDVDGSGVAGDDGDTLELLCQNFFGSDIENCKTRICDCPE